MKRQVAVALRYDLDRDLAPRVAAKGWGETARRILEIARAHDVPVKRDDDLAQVLAKLELGAGIPEKLYRAVAGVLAFVYQLNGRRGGA